MKDGKLVSSKDLAYVKRGRFLTQYPLNFMYLSVEMMGYTA